MLTTTLVTVPPAVEPASLQMVKLHCRIDHASDDLLLEMYLTAARVMVEAYLSRSLITQTVRITISPDSNVPNREHFLRRPLSLLRAPIQSVSTVTVLDRRGNLTTIPPATLPVVPPNELLGWMVDLDLTPALLTVGCDTVLVDGRLLGEVVLQNVQITMATGYGAKAETVPPVIVLAVLMTTAALYENRGDASSDVPEAARRLLDAGGYRVTSLG